MKFRHLAAVAAVAIAAPAVATGLNPTAANQPALERAPMTASGERNGLSWTASKKIIGIVPTSDTALPNSGGGGNARYFAKPNKSGVVALIMETDNGAFICSGSLLGDRVSVVTAAHCVSDGAGTPTPNRTTAFFYNGKPNERTPFNPNVRAVEANRVIVNANYTGEVIDQNDIAVVRLSEAVFGVDTYKLYAGSVADMQFKTFNVAGYGGRSTIGAQFGVNARTGFLREGDNRYDYTWGDSRFQGFFTDRDSSGENFFGKAEVKDSIISDFDNGTTANDTARRIANALGLGAIGNQFFDDTGVGGLEVGIAGGDSGGPNFIDGDLAAVNSYGLTFGTGFGDCRAGLNSSCGEFNGYVPVSIHRDFINAASAVPEPATWAMMILGFGLVGTAARRRRAMAA